jgi:hypothetical protein
MDKSKLGCKNCFLPGDFPGVVLDEEGVCNQCRVARDTQSEAQSDKGPDFSSLRALGGQLREEARQRASAYDAIIGASGGLDSTYVIYLAKEVMGLNPLVVKYSNGFGHPLADQNLRNACDMLDVDLAMVPPIELERAYLYHAIKALRNLGVFFSSCFSCHFTIAAVVYKLALEHDIGFMLTSTNPYENQLSATIHPYMLRQLWSAFWKAGLKNKVRFAVGEMQAQIALARLKLSFDRLSLRWLKDIPRLHPATPPTLQKIDLSQYVSWDIKAIELLLRKELGWRSPRDGGIPYMRFDCHVLSLIDYSFLKTIGISEHGILTNYLVQNGVFSKQDAQETFDYFGKAAPYIETANEVLSELGIMPIEDVG